MPVESLVSSIAIAFLTSSCALQSQTATARVLPHWQFHRIALPRWMPSGWTVSRSSTFPHFAQAIDFIMASPHGIHSNSVRRPPVSASVLNANRSLSVCRTGVCPMAGASEGYGTMVSDDMRERSSPLLRGDKVFNTGSSSGEECDGQNRRSIIG